MNYGKQNKLWNINNTQHPFFIFLFIFWLLRLVYVVLFLSIIKVPKSDFTSDAWIGLRRPMSRYARPKIHAQDRKHVAKINAHLEEQGPQNNELPSFSDLQIFFSPIVKSNLTLWQIFRPSDILDCFKKIINVKNPAKKFWHVAYAF